VAAARRSGRSFTIDDFIAMAEKVETSVARVGKLADLPAAVTSFLRAQNKPAAICLPHGSQLDGLDWPQTMSVSKDAPGIDDTALSLAPFAIAETGTLVHAAENGAPASWHFRPGLEIVALRASSIRSTFEDVLDQLKGSGPLPHTLNLVTGPSRTADIEQTLEVGAHGPKALLVVIIENE